MPEATEAPAADDTVSVDELLNTLSFGDKEEISDYAIRAVAAMTQMGYLKGDEMGNFAPRRNLTRAETAAVLYRILIQEDL